MPEPAEIERLAGAVAMLRPEWPAGSVKRVIQARPDLANRPLRDLAHALIDVALDPASTTPARVCEPGPWWQLRAHRGDTAPDIRAPDCPDHPGHPATACRPCTAAAVPAPPGWRADRPHRSDHAAQLAADDSRPDPNEV